jgi:hypothetical protein
VRDHSLGAPLTIPHAFAFRRKPTSTKIMVAIIAIATLTKPIIKSVPATPQRYSPAP